jgi:hypothetical protein
MTKVREFATRWDGERTWFERDKETLIGSAKESKRNTPKFRPFDMLSEPNDSLILWENQDMRIGVESVVGPAPFFRRNCDYDELLFQFSGRTRIETERGILELKPSELLLIPGGIAHRSTGSADSLRLFVRLPEPVKIVLGEDKQSSHTEFDMMRKGGAQWSLREDAKPSKGKVLERLFTWDALDEEFTSIERDYAHLVGVASEGRAVQKLRAFDFFTCVFRAKSTSIPLAKRHSFRSKSALVPT